MTSVVRLFYLSMEHEMEDYPVMLYLGGLDSHAIAHDEAEADAAHRLHMLGVLVHAGRKSRRAGEFQAHHLHRRLLRGTCATHKCQCSRKVLRHFQHGEGEVVRPLGGKAEKQWAEQFVHRPQK